MNKKREILSEVGIFSLVLFLVVGFFVFVVTSDRGKAELDRNLYTPTLRYGVIDLGSSSCSPCIKLQAELDVLRERHGDSLDIRFFDVLNTQEGASYANVYSVQILPTLLFIDSLGREKERLIGYHTASEIEETLSGLGWIELWKNYSTF